MGHVTTSNDDCKRNSLPANLLVAARADSRCEELVTEHIHGSGDDNTGVVTCLQASDQQGCLADGVRVVEDLLVGVVAVGRGARVHDVDDERIRRIGYHPAEPNGKVQYAVVTYSRNSLISIKKGIFTSQNSTIYCRTGFDSDRNVSVSFEIIKK